MVMMVDPGWPWRPDFFYELLLVWLEGWCHGGLNGFGLISFCGGDLHPNRKAYIVVFVVGGMDLSALGLTGNEGKVYRALLDLGPSLAGGIARRTGLHRRTVYDVTEQLIQKGLIGYILENRRRVFSASSPERFLDLVKEKEALVEGLLPAMMAKFSAVQEKQETNFYKGKAGLKMVFEDQLAAGGEILVLGASGMAYEMMDLYFHWFDKRRSKGKIRTKVIVFEKLPKKQIALSEIRSLPAKYGSPLAVNIWCDKVALVLWDKERPFVIVISDERVAEGYRNQFALLWKIARE